ncbi:methylated-DNA--[protein]-cysteine S-methyltransferase [Solilutibacter silvestris]|uniref:Methylated-DNA--protein-cysteine methyltransferase n=1 Tax=Solilutibacter silvestris TaxID=1645665 RepID=A0A2K1Q3K3_9GAMM|nr:methylated-DNA--[protein]-cysteine S-methyltransferase [Lysobacter silvestris]PNS09619.1 ogt: methylated-DNA-[protein]-cysteine S-methyltransferase [Lysobacter silvestris]
MKTLPVHWMHIDSPVGRLLVAASDEGIHAIEFPRNRHPVHRDDAWIEATHPLIDATRRQLGEYFAGKRETFDLPLAPRGTPFQLAVWNALREIPFGATWSYGDLARHIGQPSAVRAVGAANGRNPIPIIVPCHRVIGSDGSLTGFGGGLPTKEFLLRLEGALPTALI